MFSFVILQDLFIILVPKSYLVPSQLLSFVFVLPGKDGFVDNKLSFTVFL